MVFKFITGHKVVEARVAELPAWVFFPDVERVEWVNRFAANHLHYFTIHIWTLIIFYWNTEMLENLVLFYKGWWLSSGLLWQSSSSTSLLLRFLHLCYNMILILNCISWTFQWWSDLNENLLPCQAMQWKKNFLNCFHFRLSLWSTPACWREILAISNWSKSANI